MPWGRPAMSWSEQGGTLRPGVRRRITVVAAAVALAGCGSTHARAKVLRPPGPADVAELRTVAVNTEISCGFVGATGGDIPADLITIVNDLIGMRQRDNPDAPITLYPGAGSTTLRDLIHTVTRELERTNAFNKPVCAPDLGRRLANATR